MKTSSMMTAVLTAIQSRFIYDRKWNNTSISETSNRPLNSSVLVELSDDSTVSSQMVEQPTWGPVRGVDRTDETPRFWAELTNSGSSHFREERSSVYASEGGDAMKIKGKGI